MADCGVCLYGCDDGDAPDLYNVYIVRARKRHVCCECRCAIQVGDDHEVARGRWDGQFTAFRTCLDCEDIATALSCDGSRMHGGLWEAMGDIRHEIGFACLSKLTRPSAKAKLQDYVNKG